jgi:putative ABC transport system permease protein
MICKPGGCVPAPTPGPSATPAQLHAAAQNIARSLGATSMVELDQAGAGLQVAHPTNDYNWNGAIFVATPQLLRAYGISPSQVDPNADILSSRPGLSGYSGLQLVYGPDGGGGNQSGPSPGPGNGGTNPCPPGSCIANPVIQEMPQLPSGTSAPNTVLTEHAIHTLHLGDTLSNNGWLIETSRPLSAAQIQRAQAAAATTDMNVESKNDAPNSAEVLNWATAIGLLLALGVLAMSVGLIRAETAADLRTLTATGASSVTRRSITGVTAGALGLLGALIGTAAAYLACIAFFHSGDRGQTVVNNLSHVPVRNLLLIIVGMPLVAAIGGWLLAGREPPYVSRQPIE